MDLVSLTEFIIKNLLKNPEKLEINMKEEADVKIIQILVDSSDIGSIIGKGGNIANSIRTIIQASSYHNNLGRVRINIDTLSH